MRISYWSSDVCSSDLGKRTDHHVLAVVGQQLRRHAGNLRVEKQVEEERRHQVVAMVAQCDLVESLLFGERVQRAAAQARAQRAHGLAFRHHAHDHRVRSEEHTSELQSLMRISYAVFCLKKKNNT